ncbi:TetR family transcriptional regulator [Salinifilum aidingensis]
MCAATDHDPAPGARAERAERVRRALTLAALQHFDEQGFEATTVDQIAATAGVGRRTFFRYFRSKEDAVFPGHDQCVREVSEMLDAADPEADPWAVVTRASERVLEMYLAEPEISLRRFALTRAVPSLREREITGTDQYQRVFGRFLRGRFAGRRRGELWGTVAASAIVTGHNHVLRQWLKSGGEVDARALLHEALAELGEVFAAVGAEEAAEQRDDEVIVGVVRTSSTGGAVLRKVREALREAATD